MRSKIKETRKPEIISSLGVCRFEIVLVNQTDQPGLDGSRFWHETANI